MSHYKHIRKLKEDCEEFGEVHAVIEEIGEKDIRAGSSDFDFEAGLITVDDGRTLHRVDMGRVVTWYMPYSF